MLVKLLMWTLLWQCQHFNPIQGGLSANLFRAGGADSAPPWVLGPWGPKGPKNDSPQILWCIWAQQKKNRVDCPKIGAVSPNSKLLPNGGSGRKADFQENSRRRRKFVIARSFLDQSTWFVLQMIGKDSIYMIHDHFWVKLLILR